MSPPHSPLLPHADLSLDNGVPKDPEDDPIPSDVYTLIHELQASVTDAIDTSLTWDQLNAPNVNYALVRPIVERYTPDSDGDGNDANDDLSLGEVLYALMANRLRFLELAGDDLSYAPLQSSRAAFCELLAIKVLRTTPKHANESELASELVRPWSALDGAPAAVLDKVENKEELDVVRTSALELAIVAEAKRFLSLPLVQRIAGHIYNGELVYAPISTNTLIPDRIVSSLSRNSRPPHPTGAGARLTQRPVDDEEEAREVDVYEYNPFKAGWLDYRRLRVPRWRRWIEGLSFAILLVLFVLTLGSLDPTHTHLRHPKAIEYFFILYTFGFIVDEYAAVKEHGLSVYLASVWNYFDLAFLGVFLAYLTIRIKSVVGHSNSEGDIAFDVLSMGAVILFPRLAFLMISDNAALIALPTMLASFFGFMTLVVVGFTGIWFCLWNLGSPSGYGASKVLWLLWRLWFTGSSAAYADGELIHPILGPPILIGFSLLCGMFLVPMLTSLLSNKYSEVRSNADREHLFQRVVATVEGVKTDTVFSYFPPFNLFAIVILVPLSYVVTPETLHRVNVFMIRATNLPLLLIISAYDRHVYRHKRRAIRLGERSPTVSIETGYLDTLLGSGQQHLITTAFELEPPVKPVSALESAKRKESLRVASGAQTPATPTPHSAAAVAAVAPSPLSRIFNTNLARGGYPAGETVTVSAEEWAEMRESQKRLEALVEKVLGSVGGERAA